VDEILKYFSVKPKIVHHLYPLNIDDNISSAFATGLTLVITFLAHLSVVIHKLDLFT